MTFEEEINNEADNSEMSDNSIISLMPNEQDMGNYDYLDY
jgi:hypothetical protein